jgi:hypothetical protein
MPTPLAAPLRRSLLLLAVAAPTSQALTLRAWLPANIGTADPQLLYVRALLALALARAGVQADFQSVPLEMAQGRGLAELARGEGPLDLMWTVTDTERETSGLLPVRVPIDRGLMGWRVLLVRRNDLPRWRAPLSHSDIRDRAAGQGHDWPDTAILRANGFKVATSSSYPALFRMLVAGRFDYFPRAVLEVDAELANDRHPELAVAPGLMLRYPTASYFFVSPARRDLATALRTGLEAAVADGSLQRLHAQHYGGRMRAHAAPPSGIVRLRNPLLPPLTPLMRREFWLDPEQR